MRIKIKNKNLNIIVLTNEDFIETYIISKKKNEIFYTSKINLHTLYYGEMDVENCRLFEVTSSRGFQTCNRKEKIKNYFIKDEKIVFFYTINEFIQKIEYYLKYQDEARKITQDTYEHRIYKIFKIIGFGY